MGAIDRFLLNIRKAETPFYSSLKNAARSILSFNLPMPRILYPFFRLLYSFHYFVKESVRRIVTVLYFSPLFHSRCAKVGKRLQLEQLPEITGAVKLYLGDDVVISGRMSIASGRVFDSPEFIVGDRVFIGHLSVFSVCKRIEIEDDVRIASGCYFTDNSNHPKDPDLRAAGAPPEPDSIRPIRICRKAWIGRGSMILPGVTIGEGAIIGTGSVVTKDVPAMSVCVGNPGRVLEHAVR